MAPSPKTPLTVELPPPSSRRRTAQPASTPDVFTTSHPPPIASADISAALTAQAAKRARWDQREREKRRSRRKEKKAAKSGGMDMETLLWGYGMIIGSTCAFILGFWSIAVGPFINTEGVWLLDTLAKDTHYKYILIFLVPVTLYAVIINWWGLKIFRHA